jgi:hypothetical protein
MAAQRAGDVGYAVQSHGARKCLWHAPIEHDVLGHTPTWLVPLRRERSPQASYSGLAVSAGAIRAAPRG